jgi:two-component system phosphate regulon sensor histidine kinase PhoR
MKSKPNRIAIILIIIILIPSIFLFSLQLLNLNEDEKLIKDIYQNQLETILFSLNQYTEDVINSWRNQINSNAKTNENLKKLLNENIAISLILISKENTYDEFRVISLLDKPDQFLVNKITDIIKVKKLYSQLNKLGKKGFNKIEPNELNDEQSLLNFLTDDNSLVTLSIRTTDFIQEILAPRMQLAAGEQFVIACKKIDTDSIFYSTGILEIDQDVISNKLWLFPNYAFSIQLRGLTIEKLVRDRVYNNILLMSVLTILLIGASYFVIKNIKKEIEIAKIKSDFVSNVSHEIRTPLALISMYSETLELDRVKTEEKKREYYSIISSETKRLTRIVNSILNFSKMEAGKRTYNFTPTNITTVSKELINIYENHLKSEGFECIVKFDDNLPLISADGEAISEAILNLIDNAIKYSENNKKIEITTGKTGKNIFIGIKDYGIGISEKDQKKIFDKFFRVTNAFVHNTKGTGLGLSLVKHIMDAHNGQIELNSKIGVGSEFILLFNTDQNKNLKVN